MEKVTDQEIRAHFLPEAGFPDNEAGVRNCLADAAIRINNLLPAGSPANRVMQLLDGALEAGRAALEPDVAQPDTQTDPPGPDAPPPQGATAGDGGAPADPTQDPAAAGQSASGITAAGEDASASGSAPPASSGPGTEPPTQQA